MNTRYVWTLAVATVLAWGAFAAVLAQYPPVPPGQVNQTNASPTPVPPPEDATVGAVAPPVAEVYRCEELTRRLRQILDQAKAASDAQDSRAASGHIARAIELLAEQGPKQWQRREQADVP
ncbi:MAG: hypothetical protein ABFD92_12070 [Planctomycetaceae bacterium]|nr:hypothetical protein [Planctomycetaceae bacterium]